MSTIPVGPDSLLVCRNNSEAVLIVLGIRYHYGTVEYEYLLMQSHPLLSRDYWGLDSHGSNDELCTLRLQRRLVLMYT